MPPHDAKTESRCGVVSEQLQACRVCGKCCWSAAGTLARALIAAAEQPAPADGRQASRPSARHPSSFDHSTREEKPRVHGWDRVLKIRFSCSNCSKFSSRGAAPHPAGAPPQTPPWTIIPVGPDRWSIPMAWEATPARNSVRYKIDRYIVV